MGTDRGIAEIAVEEETDRKAAIEETEGTEELGMEVIDEECEAWDGTVMQQFLKDERGIGVIEIILILVILIGLVLLFKDQITEIVNSAFGKITSDATSILK